MAKLESILAKSGVELLEKTVKKAPKTTIGRELINNLMERVHRRGNVLVEMKGHYVNRVRIDLSSNFFKPGEKNFSIMVKPFVRGKHLMFNWEGVIIRASDVFGDGINRVKLH
jgi:hypothetical protein